MKRSSVFIIAAILLLLIVYVYTTYNGLVKKEEKVKQNWSEVQNTYQRRMDLVPNLVTVVKGVSEYEQTTLQKLVEARNRAGEINLSDSEPSAEQYNKQKAIQDSVAAAANRVIAVLEDYPEIKGTKAYSSLQAQLEGTEKRISVARKDFNESVYEYNRSVKSFPGNLVAGMLGFKPKTGFAAGEEADKSVKIKF